MSLSDRRRKQIEFEVAKIRARQESEARHSTTEDFRRMVHDSKNRPQYQPRRPINVQTIKQAAKEGIREIPNKVVDTAVRAGEALEQSDIENVLPEHRYTYRPFKQATTRALAEASAQLGDRRSPQQVTGFGTKQQANQFIQKRPPMFDRMPEPRFPGLAMLPQQQSHSTYWDMIGVGAAQRTTKERTPLSSVDAYGKRLLGKGK